MTPRKIDYWGSGPFVLTVAGRSHRFEDSDRFGPTAISAKGEILARQWGERHPFWSAYAAWVQQGRQVEDDAQTCVWEPRSPTKVRRIGRTPPFLALLPAAYPCRTRQDKT